MKITPDVMIHWKEVSPPKFKKEYPDKYLLVKEMPPVNQYIGGEYFRVEKQKDRLVKNGSVLRIRRRYKDGANMPAILSCSWWCPTCGIQHERVIEEALLDEGKAVFVVPAGMKRHSLDEEGGQLVLYLALPYTHPDSEIRMQRFQHSLACSKQLIQHGYGVLAPICMGHPIVESATPENPIPEHFAAWKDVCLRMLEASDVLCVLMLDGWKESVGVTAEILHARSLGKPIVYLKAEEGGLYTVCETQEVAA